MSDDVLAVEPVPADYPDNSAVVTVRKGSQLIMEDDKWQLHVVAP